MTFQKNSFREIFPYFRNAPEALLDDILLSTRYETAPEKLVLKKEGSEISDFFLLLSGEMRVYKASKTSREITLSSIP